MSVPNNANYYLPPVIQIPSALAIRAITQSNPMVITVSADSDQINTYIPGQIVRLTVPVTWGMWQVNGQSATILEASGNEFSLNIDSTYFDAFSIPSDGSGPASMAPSGSMNLQYSNLTNQIAFQSYNNVGN